MPRPAAALAAALAAILLLTAFVGPSRMDYELQPGRWLVFETLMLESDYVEERESEFCTTGWTRRTPEDYLAHTARGATCEITSRARNNDMLDITYACTDGPVREGKMSVGSSREDLGILAEADYTLEDGNIVPAYIDTMYLFDGPCDAAETEAATDPAPDTE